MIQVPFSFFNEANADGVALTAEERVGLFVPFFNEGISVTLVGVDNVSIATCSNEEELRNVLQERGIL